MLTMDGLHGKRVFRMPKPPSRRKAKALAKRAEAEGTTPEPPSPKKFGKVHNLVFSPDGRRVVGIMVRRPDVAGMVKRDDVFLALDSFEVREGGLLITREEDGLDAAAVKRLGLDFDRCLIWDGMDVRTESGTSLGSCLDARFDERTGAVDSFSAINGNAANALLGNVVIPAAWLVGYGSDCMVVRDEAAEVELSGGIAAKAGEGYGAAKEAAGKVAAKAGDAVNRGARSLGSAIGKAKGAATAKAEKDKAAEAKAQAGKAATGKAAAPARQASAAKANPAKAASAVGRQIGKTKGMFAAFKREFDEASK